MRRAQKPAALLAALLAAAALASCAARVTLAVGPASPALRRELSKLAAEYSRAAGFHIEMADKAAQRGATVVIDWSFMPSEAVTGSATVSAREAQQAGFGSARAFEAAEEAAEGWNELPILWDAWGTAGPRGKGAASGGAPIFAWKDLGSLDAKDGAVLLPGGEAGDRQALFWTAAGEPLPDQAEMTGMLRGGVQRTGLASLAFFKSFAALPGAPAIFRGAFAMRQADVENLAKNTGVGRLFGNLEWLRGLPGSGRRDFRSLVYPIRGGYAMPVSILAGRVVGSGQEASKARGFLLWLVSPANQKELSDRTGYMSANFNAPNLDASALEARNAALAAARIVLVDPEPAPGSAAESWDSLLAGIIEKPGEWERVLAEREKP